MRYSFYVIMMLVFCFLSCKEPEARRPISTSKSYTLANTADQLKVIQKREELQIEDYIKRDSILEYSSSPNGYWYLYINQITDDSRTPKKGDVVEFSYEVYDLNNTIIYSRESLGIKEYSIDKEDFITALQQGIKTMKVGETVKFVIPSYKAYGVIGDGNKIGINQPLISIVTLINIKDNLENED